MAVALASLLFGVLVGRWSALLFPIAYLAIDFAGIGLGWWGPGLAYGWPIVLTFLMALGVAGATLGVVARKVLARRGFARGWPLSSGGSGWAVAGAAALVLAGATAGAGEFADRTSSDYDLEEVESLKGAPLYFVGQSFEGLPLTAIEGSPISRLSFLYGDCEIPVGIDPGGCGFPLEVQNQVCGPRVARVGIFGDSVARERRAARALRPANDSPAGRPRVTLGQGPSC